MCENGAAYHKLQVLTKPYDTGMSKYTNKKQRLLTVEVIHVGLAHSLLHVAHRSTLQCDL